MANTLSYPHLCSRCISICSISIIPYVY